MSPKNPSWQAVARKMGSRLASHAFVCERHLYQDGDPLECPFCADTEVFRLFVAKATYKPRNGE